MSQTSYEKLVTLAKQDYERRVKELNISELDEILYQSMDYVDMGMKERQRFIAKKVYRPIIKKYSEEPEKWLDYIQRTCGEKWDIHIEQNPDNRELVTKIMEPGKALGDLLKVTYRMTDTEIGTVYGFTENKKTDLNVIGISHPEINLVDLAYFFAGIYLYSEIRKELERLVSLRDAEKEADAHYKSVLEYFEKYGKANKVFFDTDEEEMYILCQRILEAAYIKRNSSRKKSRLPFNDYRVARHTLTSREEKRFHYYLFLLMMRKKWPIFEYVDMIDFSLEKGIGWQINQAFYPFSFLEVLLDAMARERGILLSNYNSYKEMNSEYARSFMTKKNRSAKLQEQTGESALWKYFGYVEYDEDVDIAAIRQYEAEFDSFYQNHLKGFDLSQNAIRFRRLGQHHAAGLYYPHVKCLCVDIHSPQSMIHELGHLVDYQLGNLSAKPQFRILYKRVKEYLLNLSEEGDDLAKRLRGKTKYNLQYYLTPTEIFARCFELYAYYIWGERSNLLKEEYDGVYDTSEETLKIIKDYFDRVLPRH